MPEGAPTTDVRPRIPAPGEVLHLFSEAAGHRAQLAQLELGEARDHALVSAILAAAAGILTLLAGLALTLLAAALVWDSVHRHWWLAGLGVLYLILAGSIGYALYRRLQRWHPLAETKFQLDQDGACLARILRTFRHS